MGTGPPSQAKMLCRAITSKARRHGNLGNKHRHNGERHGIHANATKQNVGTKVPR